MNESELQKRIENGSGKEKITALIDYSSYLRQADHIRSCEYARQALEMSKEIGDVESETAALTSLSYAHFYHSEFEETRKYVDELIKIGIKHEKPNVLGTSYNIQARIAFKSGNPGTALELYLKALNYYLQEPVANNLMSCYNNLGMCQMHLANFEESHCYYKLALEHAEKLNHPARETILMNIGNIQFEQKDYKSALASYFRAEKMFRENKLLTNLGNVYFNIALTYHRQGNDAESLGYFEKSYQMQKQINDPKGMSTTCLTIASSLINMEKYDEAKAYLIESLQIAEEHNLKWNIVQASGAFAKYCAHKENYKEAYNYHEQVIKLTEELNHEINMEKMTELEAKYKTEIYKLRSDELDKENKSISEQLSRLNRSMESLRDMHQKLKGEFQEAVTKINEQDNMLSTQSRMAVMGEMISIIAHQWRQPLNIIGVLVQSFQDAWQYDEMTDEFIDKQVDVVMDQIQYMSETITDFKDFFKTDYISAFRLEGVVLKSLQLARYSLDKAEVEVLTEFDCECLANGNPNEIIQVIINIINNAREAMETDNVTTPQIKIRLFETNGEITLVIGNKGNQVADEILKRIFEPYFTTKGTTGTGIGLYVCKMIIENKYKGILEAQKTADGIEFVIKLPNVVNELN